MENEQRGIGKEGKKWTDVRKGRKAPPPEINTRSIYSE